MSRRAALLVGQQRFRDPRLPHLLGPADDARELAHILSDQDIGQFDAVRVLENPNLRDVRGALKTLAKESEPDDTILFYFSGHGINEKTGDFHLTTTDSNLDVLNFTSLRLQELLSVLDGARASKQVVLLDCCHAPDSYVKRGPDRQLTPAESIVPTEKRRALLMARPKAEFGFSSRSSLTFTQVLIDGLKGGRAASGSAGVSVADLDTYARQYITQTQSLVSSILLDTIEPIVIARSPSASTLLNQRDASSVETLTELAVALRQSGIEVQIPFRMAEYTEPYIVLTATDLRRAGTIFASFFLQHNLAEIDIQLRSEDPVTTVLFDPRSLFERQTDYLLATGWLPSTSRVNVQLIPRVRLEGKRDPAEQRMLLRAERRRGKQIGEPRRISVWLERSDLRTVCPFNLFVEIIPVEGASPVADIPAYGEELPGSKLLITVSGLDCDVDPGGHRVDLTPHGKISPLIFKVAMFKSGKHELSIDVYLERKMMLLQSLKFSISVEASPALITS